MESQLKQTRISKNLTIEDVAKALNIRKQYLIALEEGELSALPGAVYTKGYLRLYSNYLGLNENTILVENASQKPYKLQLLAREAKNLHLRIIIPAILAISLGYGCYITSSARSNNMTLLEELQKAGPVEELNGFIRHAK